METTKKHHVELREKDNQISELPSQTIRAVIDTCLTIINSGNAEEMPPSRRSSLKKSLDGHFKHEADRVEKEQEVKLARAACLIAKEHYKRSVERLEIAIAEHATTIEYEKRLEAATNAFMKTMETPTDTNSATNNSYVIL